MCETFRHRITSIFLLSIALVGCTDSALYSLTAVEMLPPPSPPDSTVTFTGTYCASNPEFLEYPVKILFILDDSGSMDSSDGAYKRVTAAQELADDLLPQGDVFIGVESFEGPGAVMLTQDPSFTDDPAAVRAALSTTLHHPGGGTPYLEALTIAETTIREDVNNVNNEDSSLLERTRYIIIFLSDGVPTDDHSSDYQAIKDQVTSLVEMDGPGDVVVNTAYLQNGSVNQTAWNLLKEMARLGDGQAANFPNGDELDYSGFDTSSLAKPYHAIVPILVSNTSARPDPEGALADSDRDGVPDKNELEDGWDPTLRDTDGDGCSDLIELDYWSSSPVDPDDECRCADMKNTLIDEDEDGLDACTESLVDTDDQMQDSDLDLNQEYESPDGLLDSLEVKWGLLPRFNDALEDYDGDMINNINEIKLHLDPKRAESEVVRNTLQYNYQITAWEDRSSTCYDFVVSNIALVDTMAAEGLEDRENEIVIYFIEAEKHDPMAGRTFKLLRTIVKYDPDSTEPQRITLGPEDFARLETPEPQ